MYPLCFEEFLWALGIDEDLNIMLEPYLSGEQLLPEATHAALMKYLKEYMVVGGLPEVVANFIETNDYCRVQAMQEKILRDHQDDIAKYALNQDKIKSTAQIPLAPALVDLCDHGDIEKFEGHWLDSILQKIIE